MGISNAEVAEAAGVVVGTVSNWRQGRTPETGAVLQLAQFFGVTVEWLLTGKGELPVGAKRGRTGLPIEEGVEKPLERPMRAKRKRA